ncbi:MAG: hypothetical protein ACOYIR_07140 [Christensenellales bacterium]|jgi:ABC-type polysaccharide/polyol phosphate export permease
MITIIVLMIFAFVILFDLIPAQKDWEFKERAVYVTILAISFVGLLLHSLNVKVPSVSDAIENIVSAIFPNAQ